MDKSHVGMLCCFICNEAYAVLLDRKLKNTLPREQTNPNCICDNCKKNYLSKGVLLFEEDGSLAVVIDEAFKKIFDAEIPKNKIAQVENGLLKKIGAINE